MGIFNKGSRCPLRLPQSSGLTNCPGFTLLHLKKRGGGFTFNAWLVTLTWKHNIQLLYSLIALPLLTECQILCPAHSPKLNHVLLSPSNRVRAAGLLTGQGQEGDVCLQLFKHSRHPLHVLGQLQVPGSQCRCAEGRFTFFF